jgi:hypothetical protein
MSDVTPADNGGTAEGDSATELAPLNPMSAQERAELEATIGILGIEDTAELLQELVDAWEYTERCPVHGHPVISANATHLDQARIIHRILQVTGLKAWAAGDTASMPFKGADGELIGVAVSDGDAAIQPMDEYRIVIGDAACIYKQNKKGEKEETNVAAGVVKLVGKLMRNTAFPTLRSVIDAPRWADLDGDVSVASTKGYDPVSEAFITRDQGIVRKAAPTQADVDAALATIDSLIGEFTYANEASRANAYAFLLTTAMRGALPTAPAVIISAGGPGSGKTLFTETVHSMVYGYKPTPAAQYDAQDWGQKQLTMRLRDTAGDFAWWDEAKGIDAMLRAVLTSAAGKIGDRAAYGSEYLEMDVRKTIVLTGNHILPNLSYENGRRALVIELEPARGRRFRLHEDHLLAEAAARRDEAHQAIATLVDNWLAKGKAPSDIEMPSFNGWARSILGILEAAGITGALENAPEASAYEAEVGALREWIMDNVHATAVNGGVRAYTVDAIAKAMAHDPIDPELDGILDAIRMEAHAFPVAERTWDALYERAGSGNVDAVKSRLGRVLAHRMDNIHETIHHADGTLIRMAKTSRGGHNPLGGKTGYLLTRDPDVQMRLAVGRPPRS